MVIFGVDNVGSQKAKGRNTHDIAPSCRPTIGTDHNASIELNSHNRCLETQTVSLIKDAHGLRNTHPEINLSLLEMIDINHMNIGHLAESFSLKSLPDLYRRYLI